MAKKAPIFKAEEISKLNKQKKLLEYLEKKKINLNKTKATLQYEHDLEALQVELLKLQNWILKNQMRVAVIFEGRDAAGKGGAIRRFKRYMNPRSMRVVALGKPTQTEKGQWYFRRYVKALPNPGEIVFFDRSWYNRAVVEPVMGFCTQEQYHTFIRQVPEFEHMLFEDGVILIKFWFAISKSEQRKRFDSRKNDPLKQWKLSPVDEKSREMWKEYTFYKNEMLSKTHSSFSPWVVIQTNSKKVARLESIRYVLSHFDYNGKGKAKTNLYPDPNVVHHFHRQMFQID
jgi:polyphosphate kinase 2